MNENIQMYNFQLNRENVKKKKQYKRSHKEKGRTCKIQKNNFPKYIFVWVHKNTVDKNTPHQS